MPVSVGYYHPEREGRTPDNDLWAADRDLLRRSTYFSCVQMYREVAGAQDEIALDILETGGSTRRFDELDASSTTLWGIARAVEKIFEETGEDKGDFVNIWLSCYEADIVSAAENFWHNKIQPSQSGL